jgi:hypothetical protein
VSIVIAWRDMGDPHRAAAWEYVRRFYDQTGWEIIVESGRDDATFARAASINAAVARASGSVIVQSDPDSMVRLDAVKRAVALAVESDGLVIPHDRYLYLTEAATRGLLGGMPTFGFGADDCETPPGTGVGNVTVFSRATWEAADGFDERFGLWGGDDAAFAYVCDVLIAPTRRLFGDMVHLWHPRLPQSHPDHPGYKAQMSILGRYRDAAAAGPDQLLELVASR